MNEKKICVCVKYMTLKVLDRICITQKNQLFITNKSDGAKQRIMVKMFSMGQKNLPLRFPTSSNSENRLWQLRICCFWIATKS